MKIYDITSNMREIMDRMSEANIHDGSPSKEQSDAIKQAYSDFEAATGDLKTKVKNTISFALELRTEREAREAHIASIIENVIKKMADQNKRDLMKEEWLLGTVHGAMQAVGHYEAIKYEEFTVAMQKQPHSCVIDNLDALSKEYLRFIPAVAESTAPDKKKILADLKDGLVIAGASLSQVAYRLVIK